MNECTKECELYPMTEGCIECKHYQSELLRREKIIQLITELGAYIYEVKRTFGIDAIDVYHIYTEMNEECPPLTKEDTEIYKMCKAQIKKAGYPIKDK
jgi:hypothetical protein